MPGHPFERGFDPRIVPHKLLEPARWRKPRRVFVGSMTDLFQDGIPEDYVQLVFQVAKTLWWHDFQFLTKRAERMADLITRFAADFGPENAWLGVSCEDRRHGLPRIDLLRTLPAQVRFVSIEPLLESLGHLDLRGIDLVIVGGETGPYARRMDHDWVDEVVASCREHHAMVFFKQWGGRTRSRANNWYRGSQLRELPERRMRATPSEQERRRIVNDLSRQVKAAVDERWPGCVQPHAPRSFRQG